MMNIKKWITDRIVTRRELDAREAAMREYMGQVSTNLATELRQEVNNAVGMLNNAVGILNNSVMLLRQELTNSTGMLRQELTNTVEMLRQELTNSAGMLRQELTHAAGMSRQELTHAVEMLRQETLNINNNTVSNVVQDIQHKIHATGLDVLNFIMQTRLRLAQEMRDLTPMTAASRHRSTAEPFEVYLEKFKNLYPHLYETWASVNFGINIAEFRERPEASCGVETRLTARHFRSFVAPYLQGQVLDVGCGPYPVPIYLQDYPPDCIAGLDPLEPFAPHPFEFVRGFAEFLPWDDATFDVVIAATSLDHVLSLDLALSEIRRVLKPGGMFLVWEWFGENTQPYNPAAQASQLIDHYHLFNFDEKWFEETMAVHFSIEEKLQLFGEWLHYYYYALKLK